MDGSYPAHEKRKYKRLKIHLDVFYQIDRPPFARICMEDKEIEAIALDLSEGGLAILTKHDIPVLSLLSIELMLDKVDHKAYLKSYESIKTKGEVRSNILTKEGKHHLGISFKDINEEDKSKIAKFIRIGLRSREEPYSY
jgi:c-di-GMP-binding flagellar brake protein YcgR